MKDSFSKGEFRNFSSYVDLEGVVRVGGRVDKVLVLYEIRYFVFFFRDYWLSRFIF